MDLTAALVRNEQAKLTATYLNGVAIALAAVGGIAPWIGAAQMGGINGITAGVSIGCTVTSMSLHAMARRWLTRMAV